MIEKPENKEIKVEKKPEIIECIDLKRIMQLIPHRYPFLMIDRVVDVVRGIGATGIKHLTINESFLQGHFPKNPIMPGVLVLESMVQTASVLMVNGIGAEAEGKTIYFTSINEVRFRRPVEPGNVLKLQIEKKKSHGMVWKFYGRALVDDKLVTEATFTLMVMAD